MGLETDYCHIYFQICGGQKGTTTAREDVSF